MEASGIRAFVRVDPSHSGVLDSSPLPPLGAFMFTQGGVLFTRGKGLSRLCILRFLFVMILASHLKAIMNRFTNCDFAFARVLQHFHS